MSATIASGAPPAAPPGAAPMETPQWKKFISMENRYIAPLFITCILLVAQLSYGVLESYPRTLLAIFPAIVVEAILSRVFTGKWPHLARSYITVITVGILVPQPEYWPYGL